MSPENLILELGLWISAFYVLSVYSYLYKYNRFFKFAEHTLIGAAAGHYLTMGITNIRSIGIENIYLGKTYYIIPIILGFLLYTRFIKEYSWIMRYGTCFMIGVGVSIYIRALVITTIIVQLQSTMKAISLAEPIKIINSVIMVLFVFTTMLYFLFTERFTPKRGIGVYIGKIGRYGIMCALGYYLGVTVMTRLAFVINRLEFLLFEWLRIPRIT
jgi:hypothetical protein